MASDGKELFEQPSFNESPPSLGRWTSTSALRTRVLQGERKLVFLQLLPLFGRETRFPDAREGRLAPQQGAEGQGVRGIEVQDEKSCWAGSVPGSPGMSLVALSKWAGGDTACRNVSNFPSAHLSTLLPKKAISWLPSSTGHADKLGGVRLNTLGM